MEVWTSLTIELIEEAVFRLHRLERWQRMVGMYEGVVMLDSKIEAVRCR